MYPLRAITRWHFFLWGFLQERFLYLTITFQQNFPSLYTIIRIILTPLLCSLLIIHRITYYIFNKIARWVIMVSRLLYFTKFYTNDEILNKIFTAEVELKPVDIEKNNLILKDVVQNRVIDYMKIVNEDFADLFENILYGGSFYKNLKVSQPDEYDLCLLIDLTRSIDPGLIEIEPDTEASYVKIKICQTQFRVNEDFWHNLLDEHNYLNQRKFREWIHITFERALKAFSGGQRRPEGYVVRHHKNIYLINFRPKGPALTLTIIRKNDWRKIEVDLVPCLIFQNQSLVGFRARKAKKWIAVAKPLQNDLIVGKDLLWRAGFQEDEKRILEEPIKPVIKLVKKLRDVKGWVHLKSYYIETLFMHELDDPVFHFLYSRVSMKGVFIYMLIQLQRKLEKGELLYYWHSGFNLLDRDNSFSLCETSKELKEILDIIDMNTGSEDGYFTDIFYRNENTPFNANFNYTEKFGIAQLIITVLYGLYSEPTVFDPYINGARAFIKNQVGSVHNMTMAGH